MKFTMRMRYAVLAILVLLIVAAPVTAYVGKDTFSWLVAKRLTVLAGGAQFGSLVQMDDDLYVTGDTTLSGATAIDGAAALAGTLSLTGNATLAGQIAFTAPTQVTVTANSTIATGNYTVIKLTAAGTVGTSTITGCATAGKLTILRNIAAQTITITDTSTVMLGGNAALGQHDTLTLLGDGTNCLQISKADN